MNYRNHKPIHTENTSVRRSSERLKIESHADTAEAKKIDRLRKDIKAERLAMSKAASEAMAEPKKLLKDFQAKVKETEEGFKIVEKTLEAKTEQFEALKIEHEAARTARYEERAAWLTKWGAAPITDGFAYTLRLKWKATSW